LIHLNNGFLADFEQRAVDRAINEWQNDRVEAKRQNFKHLL